MMPFTGLESTSLVGGTNIPPPIIGSPPDFNSGSGFKIRSGSKSKQYFLNNNNNNNYTYQSFNFPTSQ